MNINTMMFAARDFSARRGASDEVLPEKNCRPQGCAEFGLWRRCSSVTAPLWGMRPPRASPQAKLGATNVIVFMLMTTKMKIVLAYSGGLDTSVLLSWIKDRYDAELI